MSPTAPQSNASLLILECGAAAIVAALAFAWPALGAGRFARAERLFARLAQRKNIAAACAGLSVIILRLAILPALGVPLPFSPDDFSFLLQSDTFLHGRLTNPTPAMWTHFETIHVTMVPSYQSMYFPGQGLLLALGHVLFGHPWFGVLLSSAAMCAALTWALQAWLPASWALLGGFIAVLRLGVFSYWTNTYHAAGSLAALGGALILGALPRLMKTARLRYGWLIAAGASILVLTRPYEGMLLCLPVSIVLVRWTVKGKNSPGILVVARQAVLPLALIAATCAWLGYYDLKAFGSATTLPYTVDRKEYAIAPYYVWQPPQPEPHYRHAAMRAFYQVGELDFYDQIHRPAGFLPHTLEKVAFAFLFYANFVLLIPLIMVHRVFLDRRIRFLVVCVLVLSAGMVIEIFLLPHYLAPFVCAFYGIGLQAMRHLRLWKPEGRPAGLAMVRFTVVAVVALTAIRIFAAPLGIAPAEWPASNWNFAWWGPQNFGRQRAHIEAELSSLPGDQLAIVRYSRSHNPFNEWVYNPAEMDRSKVLWAREMDPADNADLLRHYPDRKAWLVEPDATPARVTPYPEPAEMRAAN
ncbi:MAG TPA: hypothetical protein VKU93_03070 [Terracidiphilus sp.]|jgi:hypothetical protein|nr:hypothetical protein [Terracidiphilus sp.]